MAVWESTGIRTVHGNEELELVDVDLGRREISQTWESPTSRREVEPEGWLTFVRDGVSGEKKVKVVLYEHRITAVPNC